MKSPVWIQEIEADSLYYQRTQERVVSILHGPYYGMLPIFRLHYQQKLALGQRGRWPNSVDQLKLYKDDLLHSFCPIWTRASSMSR